MPRGKKNESPPKSGKEIRADIKNYIRNERDTILMKWKCLEESVASQDKHQEVFHARQKRANAKKMPMNITKFINTLRRKVRKTIQEKGQGTPGSIVRALFLYWGTAEGAQNNLGTLTTKQLKKCMSSLGVTMTDSEVEEIVAYYSASPTGKATGPNEMDYTELLDDINAQEPHILEFSGPKYFEAEETEAMRFKELEDEFSTTPQLVTQFIEVSQNWIMQQMRAEGGTPHQHVRDLFQAFDHSQSHGLSPQELMNAANNKMKLNMNIDQAKAIVKFYDRKREGQMTYEWYLADVTKGTKSILAFNEITHSARQKAIQSLQKNPLVPRPFQPRPNKVLETVKVALKDRMKKIIDSKGGDMQSWLYEAFSSYDRQASKCLKNWTDVQGALARVNVMCTKEEVLSVMRSYDVQSDGSMNYALFIRDIQEEEAHFLRPNERQSTSPQGKPYAALTTSTARTPAPIAKSIQRFRSAIDSFVRKSHAVLKPEDVLYGTFLHHDDRKSGRVPPYVLNNVAQALSLRFTEDAINALVDWFDTNATHTMDYNSFVRHLYGGNSLTESLRLPRLNKQAGKADYKGVNEYRQGARYTEGFAFENEVVLNKAEETSQKGIRAAEKENSQSKSAEKGDKDKGRAVVSSIFAAAGASGSTSSKEDEVKANKLNPVIESPADKKNRLDNKRHQVERERDLIVKKLAEVDGQRKKLQEDHTRRKQKEHEAVLAVEHERLYKERIAARHRASH